MPPVVVPPQPQQLSQPVASGQGLRPARATKIIELQSGIAWRGKWMPARFRNAKFHVDSAVRESGRRIVPHEYPKKEVPYAEDMGRRAREFTIRGYIVVYPRDVDGDDLKKKDYTIARDALIAALETDGPSELQLPLLGVMQVACTRYRITEENRAGGYCSFDMSFVEYGKAPVSGSRMSPPGVEYAATKLNAAGIAHAEAQLKKAAMASTVTAPPAVAT
ncbi:DNA circularization N-terminal domain-containing protein [Bradyrhizobium sp. SRL28]|uniref:DNA circularization N-terminal domain-containing protein n=1 Tax=Bradyrhizobium sp. SRL28 TaxID=2836178 RepID=UPI001BDF2621|nr:DNA circularization N-terminal domain-containing protein [Bradyrhizobium sp. SRL28]MBT1509403.1 DNA circularization N-terminal domain-containing protein [Bradyrhizobium sp. SRL28]